jgi:hypothetical protein
MIKVYQINTKTWVWILYDDKGNQLIVSKECQSEVECFQDLEKVKLAIGKAVLTEDSFQKNRHKDDYPEFITHH